MIFRIIQRELPGYEYKFSNHGEWGIRHSKKIDMERQHLAPDQTQSNSGNSSERTPEPSVRSIPCSRQILSKFYSNSGTPEPDVDESTRRKLKQLERKNSTDSNSSLKDADRMTRKKKPKKVKRSKEEKLQKKKKSRD